MRCGGACFFLLTYLLTYLLPSSSRRRFVGKRRLTGIWMALPGALRRGQFARRIRMPFWSRHRRGHRRKFPIWGIGVWPCSGSNNDELSVGPAAYADQK